MPGRSPGPRGFDPVTKVCAPPAEACAPATGPSTGCPWPSTSIARQADTLPSPGVPVGVNVEPIP
ncbi:hypothetical protein CHLRE_02g113376v5 [Chlamydomonas reinhardtii]|uniref:Uncharacterized protein n=1 Tax=Chlamydomonas reinhardtii TaxID=3055 RepID=A0A2K3E346_CHLRE|nr:uncharacterized protein CHLRE_02g113376v5 [Chlamydomonas reinhardtii]PNW87208.1 hypothetical protein CHLRE_02g113376v5 [Chlamydomonas reinhardtii]